MSAPPRKASRPAAAEPSPSLLPCLLLRKGKVCLPSEEGPVAALSSSGAPYDPFEVLDRLVGSYPVVYVVDLDGIERGEPQLDYLQELSREATVWADAGVRNADQAIDVLVAGAAKAILSSATLEGPREVRRAWRLSTDVAFELELGRGGARLRGDWPSTDPVKVAAQIRETGVSEIVLSPREIEVDWSLVRSLAAQGPVWVDGPFVPSDEPRLPETGAAGGIFHLDRFLKGEQEPLRSSPSRSTARGAR